MFAASRVLRHLYNRNRTLENIQDQEGHYGQDR